MDNKVNITLYPMSPEDFYRLEQNFTYHKPFGDQSARYEAMRDFAKQMANVFLTLCPPSRERSLALTKLEEAVMWANASIARNEKASDGVIKAEVSS